MTQELFDHAKDIMLRNDRGNYTVPTHGLYPFQWNWDSCLSALGFAHFDEARAWREIETLFEHQWEDGLVPHIIFHELDDGYFPGPDVWQTGRKVPTSGITQPAVAGFAIKRLYDRCTDRTLAERHARALLPKVQAWHEWFFRCRDPEGTGLVAIIHPWESGRDNSVDWDAAFEHVPTDGVGEFSRRDTSHANPEHRPTQEQYERYIWLVQRFRSLDWDNSKLHDASPFQVVDPGFNAILQRSCADIAELATRLGAPEIAIRSRSFAQQSAAQMEQLWSDKWGQYLCLDRVKGSLIDSPSIGGLLAAFGDIPKARAQMISKRLQAIGTQTRYLVPSHDPRDPRFNALRYWRGPVWLIVNYMIADGLARAGDREVVDRIISDSMALIEKSGFAEYYDPMTAEPCGGDKFTWTAAMVIEFLKQSQVPA